MKNSGLGQIWVSRFRWVITLSALVSMISGCAIISPRANSNQPVPQVRDVSYQARESRDTSPRKRIMVLPFLDEGVRSKNASQVSREVLLRALYKSGDFVVVSTNDFPKDVTSFLKNNEYDLETMSSIGHSLGLAAIIEGRVIEIKAKRIGDEVGLVRRIRARIEATVRIRMVNTKNGSIMLDEVRTADIEDTTTRVAERSGADRYLEDDPLLIDAVVTRAFQSTIPRIAQSIEKLSWEGRVALVKGDRVYLNAGRLSGIMIGDILKVTEEGEDVFDPETGTIIGKVPGRLKGTVEVVSYFGKDGAVGVIHSGSGFRENDRVELY